MKPTNQLDAHVCAAMFAGPSVLTAYLRPETWPRSRFLLATKLKCMPVRTSGVRAAYIVVESIPGVEANNIVRFTARLDGVRPADGGSGFPVAHYRPSIRDLAFRFPAPAATPVSRQLRVTGGYKVAGVNRFACFVSTPQPTCV